MENWEELDVDDSDLPSLLRSCINKRKHHAVPSPPSPSLSTNPQSQTPISPPQQPQGENQTYSVNRPRIPGPAGAVQAAMIRRGRADCCRGEDEVSTQECIRRAVENDGGGDDDDDDFKLGPWLCAVEFVSRQGPLPSTTPLSSISKFLDVGRIDRVVAVIKSCTPNGQGDLMVALKDPTGTIGASIHRKVFADGEFVKEISVGSVLILQKVAVFAPSRSTLYLNIMRSNVVKVICKDSGAPTKQNTHASSVKPTSGHYKEALINVEEAFSREVEMTRGFNNGFGHCSNSTGSVNNNKETEKENNADSFIRGDQNDTSAEHVLKKVFRKEIIGEERRGLNASFNLDEGQKTEGSMRTNGVQKEKQPTTARSSLPEWTDEQLNELFPADYDDDGSFF